jgi:putative ABC transport system permease protein
VLLKRPGFTLTAALTLALGIGVTTAMFSVVDSVLLRRLPYGDEARVVVLWQNNLKNGVEREEASPANFFDWRDRAQSLDIVSAAEPFAFNLSGTGEPETFRSWIVTAGFFDALNVSPLYGRTFLPQEYEPGAPLLRGRELNQFDKADAASVALVNNSMAVRNWPTEDPIGKKVTFAISGRIVTCEIVGVVGDVRPNGLDSAPRLEIYVPYAQSPASLVTWVVRTTGDPLKELGVIKEKIREGNPTQTFLSIATMDQLVDRTLTQRRFNLMLLGSFAALALILAAVGLYGLISYTTAQRKHEIGVRRALGAQTGDVLKLVVGEGIRLALIGVAIGLTGALGLTRFLSGLLYGVKPGDPLTFVAVSALLIAVALLASYLPARKAAKVDPLVALSHD